MALGEGEALSELIARFRDMALSVALRPSRNAN